MTTPVPPAQPDAAAVAGPSTEERFFKVWEANRSAIFVLAGVVILAILAKGAWGYFADQKEAQVRQSYAEAATPEALKAFVQAHDGHPLAGAASLKLADGAYEGAKYGEAATEYQAAISSLPAGPLVARARLGLAMAQIASGKAADGEALLKQLSSDTTLPNAVRSAASYQLASIAASAGRNDEALHLADTVAELDQVGWWAQRAFALRNRLTASAPAAASALKIGSK